MQNKDFKSQSISLGSVINARELGGFRMADGRCVRHGLLLRGAGLGKASKEDIERLVKVYSVRKVFDFRMDVEVNADPDPEIPGVENIRLPAMDRQMCQEFNAYMVRGGYTGIEDVVRRGAAEADVKEAARTMYSSMVMSPFTQKQYARFMREVVGTPEGAVYWHCTQGKDRTGLAAAFMLYALGADRETVLEDYAISNEFYIKDIERLSKEVLDKGWGEEELEVVKTFIGANANAFKAALDLLEKEYGSMMGFIHEKLEVSGEDIEVLRLRYLE